MVVIMSVAGVAFLAAFCLILILALDEWGVDEEWQEGLDDE